MSAHDRAAINHAHRFTLVVTRVAHGCLQSQEFPRLTRREVEAEKAFQRECYSYPGSPYAVSFEVEVG